MTTTGGIARFARKPAAAAAATAAVEETNKDAAAETEFSGFGGGVDDASFGDFGVGGDDFGGDNGGNTPSGGDDFGFMGGGGGDSADDCAFDFMGDGSFNEEGGFGDESSSMVMMEENQGGIPEQTPVAAMAKTTINVGGGAGIALFKNRVVTAPHSNGDPRTPFANAAAAASNANVAGGTSAAAAAAMSTSRNDTTVGLFAHARNVVQRHAVTPNSQAPNGRLSSVVPTQRGGGPFGGTVGGDVSNNHHQGVPQTLMATPRGLFAGNVGGVNNRQGNPQTLTTTPRGGPLAGGPFAERNKAVTTPHSTTLGGTITEMALQPVRRPAVTPATVVATKPREGTPVPTQQQYDRHYHHGRDNDDWTLMPPDAGPNAKGNDDNNDNESFHNMHQQFTIAMRDFHDKESHYKDTLLDSTVKLDLATALLLHIKVESLDLTDQLDDLSCSYHETIRSIATE